VSALAHAIDVSAIEGRIPPPSKTAQKSGTFAFVGFKQDITEDAAH
jgi:hypothetical protein